MNTSSHPLAEETKPVICRSCNYSGSINTWHASMGMYSDCCCPKCGSTDNEHNDNYARELSAAMSKAFAKDKS
jgi:hypothetical protein